MNKTSAINRIVSVINVIGLILSVLGLLSLFGIINMNSMLLILLSSAIFSIVNGYYLYIENKKRKSTFFIVVGLCLIFVAAIF